ncbi:DUF4113 domain-containing protein, partial [Escherichia coli]|nr:DUF4113 domain-containing protein [Escherichia coli]
GPKTSIICSPMTSLKTSIKTITYLSDIGCLEIQGASLPTQDSRDIIAAACRALNHVWREGYRYMKAGVMLADFTPSGIAQPGLFDEIQPRKNSEKLMKTLDELNQSGKGKVWFAGRGTAPEWQMKREMLSQCYTTKWRDIPLARLG